MIDKIAGMSNQSKPSAQTSVRVSKIIWVIQNLSLIIYVVVVLVLAEQNGGVHQWQGMLNAQEIAQHDVFLYIMWCFVSMSLIVGLYVAKHFKRKRLDPSLSIDQKSRLLLRQTTVVLTMFNGGATFALLFALMGGSIWHFLGIIFIVLNFKVSQYPRL